MPIAAAVLEDRVRGRGSGIGDGIRREMLGEFLTASRSGRRRYARSARTRAAADSPFAANSTDWL